MFYCPKISTFIPIGNNHATFNIGITEHFSTVLLIPQNF